jgi:hypothetical protein
VLHRIERNGYTTRGQRESSVSSSFLDAKKPPVGYANDLCLKPTEAMRQWLALKSLAQGFVPFTPGSSA